MMTMMTAAVPVAVRPSPSINVSERPDSNQRQSKRRGQEPMRVYAEEFWGREQILSDTSGILHCNISVRSSV